MTRTVRRYNKKPMRLGPGYCGWISSNKIPEQDKEYPTIWYGDYHPWKQRYHIDGWKDWRLDSRRRQAWKAELIRVSYWEGWSGAWEWFNEVKSSYLQVPNIWEDLDD